jgi:hypothetical protein
MIPSAMLLVHLLLNLAALRSDHVAPQSLQSLYRDEVARVVAAQMDSLPDSTKVRLWASALRSIFGTEASSPYRVSSRLVCMSKSERECGEATGQIATNVRLALRRLVGGCPAASVRERLSLSVSVPVIRSDSATILVRSIEAAPDGNELNEQVFRVRVPTLGADTARHALIYHGQVTTEPRGALPLANDDSCELMHHR